VGESARLPLRGAGSAGYDWTWTIDGDADALRIAVEPAPGPPPPGTPFHAGSVGLVAVIEGVRPGSARVDFVLARPRASTPLEARSFAVKVE
jgi:hypothetical protein